MLEDRGVQRLKKKHKRTEKEGKEETEGAEETKEDIKEEIVDRGWKDRGLKR